MEKIVTKFLDELTGLLKERHVEIRATAAAKEWLAKKGFDPAMGARPLSRVIQEEVKKPLTEEILFGKLQDGGIAEIQFDPEGKSKTAGGPADLKGGLTIAVTPVEKESSDEESTSEAAP